MVTQGMIDLETLGTSYDSVVLTIGAAKFGIILLTIIIILTITPDPMVSPP